MSEKTPRRMPVQITAERLDYKESVARSENKRVRNRLELNKGTLTDHESTNLSSMNYEMRRLKHELKGIKQTSGYLIVNKETSEGLERGNLGQRSRRRHKPRVAKKKHRVTQDAGYMPRVEEKAIRYSKDLVNTDQLPVLSNISHTTTEKQVLLKGQDASELSNAVLKIPDSSNVNRTLDTTTIKHNTNTSLTSACDKNSSAPVKMKLSGENREEYGTITQEKLIRPSSREMTKSDTILGLDVDAARGRIQNRLTASYENSDQTADDSDLNPYMHVPPDGLPRTVYLLPPLKDLFAEAKKARYIRKLRKPHMVLDEDDPERELNIDEIFRKT
ncbi:uncharacterized protein LOC116303565 [Actinia tenebrosa]|uniref:Uncharacterized protein LOC116303565 n=1 Tax=Actinia tenebrosa TaxID=6105 RepID=A0A6P8IPL4_ACTTE|nr:uncharacterized protein LOC116303565 [Actinia tenebrosa]